MEVVRKPVSPAAEPARGGQQLVVSPPLWRSAAFLIIVITGVFHLWRGATVDGVIFLLVAVALVLADRSDQAERADTDDGTSPRRRWTAGWTVLVLLACLVAGWLIGPWRAATVPMVIAVALPGLLLLPLALFHRPRVPRPASGGRPVRSGWRVWAVIGVLICLWELAAFLQQESPTQSSYDHPTLSVILGPLFESTASRTWLFAAWLAAGVLLAKLVLERAGRGWR